MDSWAYGGCERLNFGLSDGVFSPYNPPLLEKEASLNWEMGNSCNSEHSVLDLRQGTAESPIDIESVLQGTPNMVFERSAREYFGNGEVKEHLVNSCTSPVTRTSAGEKEEGSKDSSSIVDPDAHDSSFIDLKLGRLLEWRGSEDSKSSEDLRSFSTQSSPAPAKRIRSSGSNGQTSLCQVHGCNTDLSSFKDYYKRHRVCQVHSKTAKVIVNGIQQRFCQQCSRFHVLSEFDDGKRSCRKRLVGHNERRRKPQIVFQSGKGSLMLPYHGGNFLASSLSGKPSFLCHNGNLQHGNSESANWSKVTNFDSSFTSMQMKSPYTYPKSATSRGTVKEISFAHGGVSLPGGIYNGYTSQYGGMPVQNSVSDGIDDSRAVDKGHAGVFSSSRAYSLLSAQTASLCASPLQIPMTQPALFINNDPVKSEPSFAVSFPDNQASTDFICSSEIDSQDYSQAGFVPLESKSSRDVPFCGDVVALPNDHYNNNLLQLSLLLHDAESCRSLQVKQEFEPFACPPFL